MASSSSSTALKPGVHPLTDGPRTTQSMKDDVIHGLSQTPKQLPAKYLYDERGSSLFDDICTLEAYYPTRTEVQILDAHANDMASHVGAEAALVEYGSGTSQKTHRLLEALHDAAAYVPIDIAREHLLAASERIAEAFPELPVFPVWADYTAMVPMPVPADAYTRAVAFYPGSTIGNFLPEQAVSFLKQVRTRVGANGGLLIGADLKKDPDRLRRAYDDPEGVTAAFNKNLLVRLNRELDANFAVDQFRHEARWDAEHSRIEMHLVSQTDQTVQVAGQSFAFEAGASICTEYSHKYTLEGFDALLARADWQRRTTWTDPNRLFSVHYAEPAATEVSDS
ncbi:MAG: L-histidine N(alpha)-methyltransferase [Longimonas sp.]|uniref:L-histidine N(alpha)-methyltransferase n=1 Tax=Longimonas sp. TaxID=2039626 RepID=UPI00397688FE